MTESSVACSWISVTASRMFSTEFSGNARSSSSTRRLDSSCSPGERQKREREEEERDESEDREVRDHRRQVRAAVGQKLADDGVHGGEGVYGRVLGLPPVEAAQALADLVEISSQIESAVLADGEGAVLASTFDGDERASAIAGEAIGLLQGAAGPGGEPSQVQIAFLEGSRLRRPRRRAHRCGRHRSRADVGPRLLRPEDVPAPRRRAAGAQEGGGGRAASQEEG